MKIEEKIVKYLLVQGDYVNVKQIAADCEISQRSIYNYLNKLKSDRHYIIHTGRKGIRLFEVEKEDSTSKTPETYEERRMFIFRKGLIAQKPIYIDRLQNYLAISDSTLHSDIIRIRREIAKYHVRLAIKGNEMNFVGNYHDLKKLSQSLIYQEVNEENSILSVSSLQEMFSSLDVAQIRTIIVEELEKQNFFMDEYSLMNLLLHILISLNQETNGVIPIHSNQYKVSKITEAICSRLKELYGYDLSNTAKKQFDLIIQTRAIQEEKTMGIDELKSEKTIDLVNQIIEKIYSFYNIDLNVAEFRLPFTLHLDNLLERIETGVTLNNPLLNNIKHNSPITYDLAVLAANIVSRSAGVKVSESEIAYIALHIGARIEEIKNSMLKLSCAIVCPEYYTYNSGLRKIITVYNDDLYITNVFTSFDQIISNDMETLDLIITTIAPNHHFNGVHILQISNFLTSEDRKAISQAIVEVKRDNMIDSSRESLKEIFVENLFFSDISFSSCDEAIDFLADKLYKNGYVSDGYKEAVKYREQVAPTDFDVIAIPHPVEFKARKTVVSVAILNKKLDWGKSKVSIIFMIAVNNQNITIFENLFSSLISVCTNIDNLQKLSRCREYSEFLNMLLNMFYEKRDMISE